ncbi:pyridoxamine 5'-phosphate oxidase family protein [Actinomadura scrupuli]|uniref:pyridoxamine 5'-phosphate oxidase family protein n=1 Tax=Actinomadura scrupuli TaxID=559629 RepID=UPI003D99E7EF
MRFDAHGLEILERADCLRLLASVPLGRVVFTDRALPAIQPVNFVLDGEDVIIRASTGSKLALAMRDTVVAFEADDIDPATNTGWSVTLVGHARPVEDPGEITRLARLRLRPWTPGPSDRFVRISGTDLAGRRIHRPTAEPGDLVA